MASIINQEGTEKVSKKQFSRTVLARLTSSLAEYNLKDKKLENRLKKVSKQLAADIIKKIKASQKENGEEQTTEESGTALTVVKKKAGKNKEAAAL